MTDDVNEYEKFRSGLRKVLKADPKLVKVAMEQEKQHRAEERKAKRASSSGVAGDRDT